jgi:hypothetical protein
MAKTPKEDKPKAPEATEETAAPAASPEAQGEPTAPPEGSGDETPAPEVPTEEDIIKTIEIEGLEVVNRTDYKDDASLVIAVEANYSDGTTKWFGDASVEERVKSDRQALLEKAGLGGASEQQQDDPPADLDPPAVETPATDGKLPTRGPGAKKVRCINRGCGWTGIVAEMKVDPRLQKPHYCPKCGHSNKIEDVEG